MLSYKYIFNFLILFKKSILIKIKPYFLNLYYTKKMSSFFQKIKVKKESQFVNQSKNIVRAAEKKDTLPDDFFEQILACEIQLKKGFSMNTLRKLINLYSRAVEYYESINDPRYMRYSKSLQVLLLQPQIVKQINMQTKKGKIKVHKQERKKALLDEFKNLDKKFVNNSDAKDIISKTNKEEKAKNFDEAKNKDLDTQESSFKKRLAEKKKKWIMNTSDIGQSSNLQSKNLVVFSNKKHLNKSFDAIGQDDSIFSNDLSIEPISMYNCGENTFNITDGINNNLDFYFSDFDNIFNEKITKQFINKIVEINKEKMEEKVKTARDFAEKIKNKEFQLTFDSNTEQEERDKIGKEIFDLGEEQNKKYDEIEKKYEAKINEAKDELKNQSIQNMEWIRNLKEKYISDIDSTIYNFIGN